MKKSSIIFGIAAMVLVLMIIRAVSLNLDYRIAIVKVLSIEVWIILFVGSMIVMKPQAIFSKQMLAAYIYALIVIVMTVVGHLTRASAVWLDWQVRPLLVALLLYELFRNVTDERLTRRIMLLTGLFIGVSCILNIRGLLMHPLAVRAIVGGQEGAEARDYYSMIGISNYGFFSGLPALIPVYFYMARNAGNLILKWLFYLLIILIIWAIFLSTITTPLLVAAVVLILSFFGTSLMRRSYAFITIITVVLVSVFIPPQELFNRGIDGLIALAPHSAVERRLGDVKIATAEGVEVSETGSTETTVEQRLQRVLWNLDTISRYPLFGNATYNPAASFHLFWLYFIASLGLVGFLPFLVTMVLHVRQNLASYQGNYNYYYLLSMSSFIAMGMMKNVTGWFMYLVPFFIVPTMYYAAHGKSTHENSSLTGIANTTNSAA